MNILDQDDVLNKLRHHNTATATLLDEIHFLRSRLKLTEAQKNEKKADKVFVSDLDRIFALPIKFGFSPYYSVGVTHAYEKDLDKFFGITPDESASISIENLHLTQEIDTFFEAANFIDENYKMLIFDTTLVRKLHWMAMRNSVQKLPGQWRTTFQPLTVYNPFNANHELVRDVTDAAEVPRLMESLHKSFDLLSKSDIDPLILLAIYYIIFLRIHPFRDGNGRTGRLLMSLLLYHADHPIGRYVSLEYIYQKTLTTRNWAINESYKDPTHILDNALPYVEYFLEVIRAAYKGFEQHQNEQGLPSKQQEKKIERPFDILKDIIMKCWEDNDFKLQFLKDPKAVLLEKGLVVSPDMSLHVHENTEQDLFLVIPEKPDIK
jgi:fido (protein-threonine AMPylation protein)